MKFPRLAFSALALFTVSCLSPQSEETLLFESLEKLPSVSVNDASSFSLGNENILLGGKQQELTLETILLFSGFTAAVKTETESICLDNPDSFTKYPFAAKKTYALQNQGIEVSQLQFFSKDKAGITLLYSIKNVGNSAKSILFQFQPAVDLKPSLSMDSTYGSNSQDQISFDQLTRVFTAKDVVNDWFAVWGTSKDFSVRPSTSNCEAGLSELGSSAGFEITLELDANATQVIPVFLAGSDQSEFTAIETFVRLRDEIFSDWDENFALIDSLQSTSKINIPDRGLQEAYEWSKYRIGLFEFNEAGESQVSTFNPEELHSILGKLSKDFIAQLDSNLFNYDETTPRHIAPGWELIQPSTLILMGIQADLKNRVTYIRPNLPKEWNEVSIENLWVDDNKLTIKINSEENHMTVEITQTQKKAGLSIELPEKFSKVKVLGKEVNTDTKDGFRRILMTGDHVKIEANL